MEQIRDKKYPDSILEYTGDLLLVGINYNKRTKEHECRIEKIKNRKQNAEKKNVILWMRDSWYDVFCKHLSRSETGMNDLDFRNFFKKVLDR